MSEKSIIRAKELREPLYELSLSDGRDSCITSSCTLLTAKVYDTHGNSNITYGRYLVTNFWEAGLQKIMWKDERGLFSTEKLEELILEVEQDWEGNDLDGKPLFVNGFMFTRRTRRRGYDNCMQYGTLYECPVEFFQIEVDTRRSTNTHKITLQ